MGGANMHFFKYLEISKMTLGMAVNSKSAFMGFARVHVCVCASQMPDHSLIWKLQNL